MRPLPFDQMGTRAVSAIVHAMDEGFGILDVHVDDGLMTVEPRHPLSRAQGARHAPLWVDVRDRVVLSRAVAVLIVIPAGHFALEHLSVRHRFRERFASEADDGIRDPVGPGVSEHLVLHEPHLQREGEVLFPPVLTDVLHWMGRLDAARGVKNDPLLVPSFCFFELNSTFSQQTPSQSLSPTSLCLVILESTLKRERRDRGHLELDNTVSTHEALPRCENLRIEGGGPSPPCCPSKSPSS